MLTKEKQQFLIDHLAQSAEDFENAVATIDASHWNARPKPDCWSVAEIAEHVSIIDARVAALSATFKDWPDESYDQEAGARKDQLILRIATDRGSRIEAPPQVTPTGKLENQAQFYPGFRETQTQLSTVASGNPELLRGRFRDHPFLKKLDGYQWLLVCSCHRRRHMDQIEDVKRALAL